MFFDPNVDGLKPSPLTHNCYSALVTPRPIGWISTISTDGVINLAPYSFFNMATGDPMHVMVCVNGFHADGGMKDTVINAEAQGEFVYNLCDADLIAQMNASSEHVARSIDEMAATGLEAIAAEKVAPPRVKAAKVHLECKHIQTVRLPDGKNGSPNNIVIGRVVGIHIADDILTDGVIDYAKLKPLARLGYLEYAIVEETFTLTRPD